VPPYVRKTKTLEAALPWLYLKGVSSGEMGAALKVLLGPNAKGLSANTVSRLKRDWAQEYDGWREQPLDKEPWVYIWADGVYSGLRGEQDKLCALVIVGVNARGQKHFLAIEDGVRESTQSWREVLLALKARGMNAPKLAIGDGAMGFWAALEEVFPESRQQRCWMHKTMNVLNCLPKLSQPKAKAALHNNSFAFAITFYRRHVFCIIFSMDYRYCRFDVFQSQIILLRGNLLRPCPEQCPLEVSNQLFQTLNTIFLALNLGMRS
jgi:transposase-like protein